MRELTRLLRYSRPYVPHLLLSVILMAVVGAAQAMTALLIQPILDRVLNPQDYEPPVTLFTVFHRTVYLNDLMPHNIHTIWSMVATAILTVFFLRGICDYCDANKNDLWQPYAALAAAAYVRALLESMPGDATPADR